MKTRHLLFFQLSRLKCVSTDMLFNTLAQRAAANVGQGYLGATETYMKLALHAQSQCRPTWEAVSAIKNPPIAGYVGQANVAHGPQQVNKGSRARKTDTPQNKLLEAKDGERLDTRTASASVGTDPSMATFGEIDRPED